MGKDLTTDRGYRPTLSANPYKTRRWLTSQRLRIAWNLAKETVKGEGISYPATSLLLDLGISQRSLYRWLNEKARPGSLALYRLNCVFDQVLGENWQKIVMKIEDLQEETQ